MYTVYFIQTLDLKDLVKMCYIQQNNNRKAYELEPEKTPCHSVTELIWLIS
jgi:hypothetical protein